MMIQRPMLIFSVILSVFCASKANADEAANILKIIDANLTKVRDQTYEAEVKVIRSGTVIKSMNFTAKLKGLRMKLVRFTAPGDVRGMSVLTTADGLMYVYLPSYQRVRRIASHVRNQGFMGTDFTPDDFGTATMSEGWTATVEKQDDQQWVLIMKPMPGTETSYTQMRVTVLKKYGGVSQIEYFGENLKVVKVQVRDEWKVFGPLTVPTRLAISDQRTGSKTEVKFSTCQVNTGLDDSVFTTRALLRAN